MIELFGGLVWVGSPQQVTSLYPLEKAIHITRTDIKTSFFQHHFFSMEAPTVGATEGFVFEDQEILL